MMSNFKSAKIPTQAIMFMIGDSNLFERRLATTSCYLIRTPASKQLAGTVYALNAHIHRSTTFKRGDKSLSGRQKEVLALSAMGLTYSQIGNKLAIGEEQSERISKASAKNECKQPSRSRGQASIRKTIFLLIISGSPSDNLT